MKRLIVKVTGNIIIETKGHVFHHDIACLKGDDIIQINRYKKDGKFQDNILLIDGDLVLDELTAVLPYASYIAMKDVAVCGDAKPSLNVNSWRERNKDIIDKLSKEVPCECMIYFYNGLYLSLCSSLELALMDILLMNITSFETFYKKSVLYYHKVDDVKQNNIYFDGAFIKI